MPRQEGNEKCQGYHHEEWQASYAGRLPDLRHQDVQNRQIRFVLPMKKTGILCREYLFSFF